MYIIFKTKNCKKDTAREEQVHVTIPFFALSWTLSWREFNCQDLMEMENCHWSSLGATLPHVPSTPFAILEWVALSLTFAIPSPLHRPFSLDLRWSRTCLTSFENQSHIPHHPSVKKKSATIFCIYLSPIFWGVCMYEKYIIYIYLCYWIDSP